MHLLAVLLYISFVTFLPVPGQAEEMVEVEPVHLTEAGDLEDLNALRDVLVRISESVSACVQAGKESAACQCEHFDDIQEFQAVYSETLEKHPEWAGQVLYQESLDDEGNVTGISTSFFGLQKQYELNETLDCP